MKKADIQALVKQVAAFCEAGGHRFTQPRRIALEIIAASPTPISAYDVLAKMGEHMPNPKPPTAYRAIEFLEENHIVHRIESLNAYVLCRSDHHHDGSQFLICDDCGKVTEVHLCDLPAPLSARAQQEHFHLSRWNVELHGTCRDCAHGASAPQAHHCH
jgi:Fur family zinc uptake transcriptional regulator